MPHKLVRAPPSDGVGAARRQLTHLALALLKPEPRVRRSPQAKRPRTIQFADELPAEDARDPADESSATERTSAAEAALLELIKAVKVSTDGIQVLQRGGLKQTVLQASSAAITNWRFIEIGTYTVLAELYDEMAAPHPEREGPCIVCSKAKCPNEMVRHTGTTRGECARREMKIKRKELFEESDEALQKANSRLEQVKKKIELRCRSSDADGEWCRHMRALAHRHATQALPAADEALPGSQAYGRTDLRVRGLAAVMGTHNPALLEALRPHKASLSAEKNELNEKLRILKVRPGFGCHGPFPVFFLATSALS